MEIEFRWLRVSRDIVNQHPSAITRDQVSSQVLQVRQMVGHRGEGWWSDWKDVGMIDSDYPPRVNLKPLFSSKPESQE